jgi:hypothetical protein
VVVEERCATRVEVWVLASANVLFAQHDALFRVIFVRRSVDIVLAKVACGGAEQLRQKCACACACEREDRPEYIFFCARNAVRGVVQQMGASAVSCPTTASLHVSNKNITSPLTHTANAHCMEPTIPKKHSSTHASTQALQCRNTCLARRELMCWGAHTHTHTRAHTCTVQEYHRAINQRWLLHCKHIRSGKQHCAILAHSLSSLPKLTGPRTRLVGVMHTEQHKMWHPSLHSLKRCLLSVVCAAIGCHSAQNLLALRTCQGVNGREGWHGSPSLDLLSNAAADDDMVVLCLFGSRTTPDS